MYQKPHILEAEQKNKQAVLMFFQLLLSLELLSYRTEIVMDEYLLKHDNLGPSDYS